jgi:hypothetical protein
LIVLTALLLALASIAGVWFLLIKPPPAPPFFLTIQVGDFNARQYPVLPFARQDGDLLQRHFPTRKQAETKTRELMRHELHGLATRSDPVVIHIDALGLVRGDKIYLVPGDADPDDDSTLLDVREVIEAVGRCPAHDKLLILDLSHPLADARLGVLADRVSQTMEEYLTREPPSFFVLLPASSGEYSLDSEILQCSVLASYLDQALQGAADSDRDLRITVQELAAYVAPRVDRWGQLNRGVRQRPRLFGKADDFVLASVGRNSAPALDRPNLEAYPASLQEGWKKRDAWRGRQALRRAPRLLMKLEATLLRQEERWRGGGLGKHDVDALDGDIAALDRDIGLALAAAPPPARSLVVAMGLAGYQDNAALVDAVMNTVAAAKDTGGKKEAQAKLIEELVKKLQEPKEITFVQQATAIVDALNQAAQLRPEYLDLARDVVACLSPTQRYLEVLYLRRLTDFAERIRSRDPDAWPAEKVHTLLQAVRWREKAIATLSREPGLLPWVGPALEAGDALRQTGERKLLWERASNWPDAWTSLQAAAAKYKRAAETLDGLARSRVDLDRALADLSYYSDLLCGLPELDADAEVVWSRAAEDALAVQRFFAASTNKESAVLQLDAPSRSLHRNLQELDKLVTRKAAEVHKGEQGVTLSLALALLSTPLMKAADRLATFGRQRELAAKLQGQTDELDQEEVRASRFAAGNADRLQDVGLLRARMSLAVLRLGGVVPREPLPELNGDLDARAWAQLEGALHDLWARDLLKRWNAPQSLAVADLLDRLVPPWEVAHRAGTAREASVQLDKNERAAFARWLEERYQLEARFLEARDPAAATFFIEAARELRLKTTE